MTVDAHLLLPRAVARGLWEDEICLLVRQLSVGVRTWEERKAMNTDLELSGGAGRPGEPTDPCAHVSRVSLVCPSRLPG